MSEQLSEKGKDLVKYMPHAVNALADRLIENLEERLLYGEKPQTNADRTRAMTDEELAETYANGCPNGDRLNCGKYYLHGGRDCFNCWLDWLKSPVEVDDADN